MSVPELWHAKLKAWNRVASKWDQLQEVRHPLCDSTLQVPAVPSDLVPAERVTKLAQSQEERPDRAFLRLWRLAPEPPEGVEADLRALWPLLPGPSGYSVWEEASAASALAGAGETPALLEVALGPVQGFISQSRSTSDLWAGSHLLACAAWEAMRPLVEHLGPDAVILPSLRGIPLIDRWLAEQGVPFKPEPRWKTERSDANPLFSAAVPNRFIVVVPRGQSDDLARKATASVRGWVSGQARAAAAKVFGCNDAELPGITGQQITDQLEGFPEVAWASVPISKEAAGLLRALRGDARTGEYAAAFAALERGLAAAKALRPFAALQQDGYRCTLCGEREWLTNNRALLAKHPNRRGSSVWSALAKSHPSWARAGEHLCALCTLKRLWPTLFAEEVNALVGGSVRRYVVSTHTMALAGTFDRWLEKPTNPSLELRQEAARASSHAALPRNLRRRAMGDHQLDLLEKIPVRLDELRERVAVRRRNDRREQQPAEEARSRLNAFQGQVEKLLGDRPEAYYGLLLMDGDHMGALLSSPDTGEPTAAYHASVSASLGAFATQVAPFVVEELFKGKLLYCGGDDLLAMVSVDDLLGLSLALRLAYVGLPPPPSFAAFIPERLGRLLPGPAGFARLDDRLVRLLGPRASCSAGAVVAHHQAPLQRVLGELRDAERAAKAGGRNTLALRVLRRSGAPATAVASWGEDGGVSVPSPISVLLALVSTLADEHVSRRAAYHLGAWLQMAPGRWDDGMLAAAVARQLRRQDRARGRVAEGRAAAHRQLAGDLETVTATHERQGAAAWNLVQVAELLARQGRAKGHVPAGPWRPAEGDDVLIGDPDGGGPSPANEVSP